MSDFDPKMARSSQLKTWLTSEGVAFEDSDDAATLRALATRRLKRKQRESNRVDPLGAIWGVKTALSISELKAVGEKMRSQGLTGKRFPKVMFKIDDIADDMIVLRHTNDMDGCRGKVVDGKCKSCGEHTSGVHCFRFEMVLADLHDNDTFLEIMGADGIGSALFKGRSAGVVNGMSRAEIDDIIDKWTEVPIIASFAVSVDPESDEVKMFPFNMRRLPMSYMPK